MMVLNLIRFWRSLTKKDSVKSARYEIPITFFSTFTLVLERFFLKETGSGFFGSDPVIWPIRIRTQKKKSDPDSGEKNPPGPKH